MRHVVLCIGLIFATAGAAQAQREVRPVGDSALAVYADSAWVQLIRARIGGNTGVHWDPATTEWVADTTWKFADDAARTAYATEPDLRGALALAAARRDVRRLDDVADFFVAYHIRFRPLSSIVGASRLVNGHSRLLPQGAPDAMVLPWFDRQPGKVPWPSECSLCTSQAMAPAARLLHLIAATPQGARTPAMVKFAAEYTQLLAHDVVVRFGYQTHWLYNQPNGTPFVLGAEWTDELAGKPGPRYRMLDRDLWLIAIGTDVLMAHHADPVLVPLLVPDSTLLSRFVNDGVRMIALRENPHEVVTPEGSRTTADLLFRGEFDADPDMAFAADTSSTYPDASHRAPPSGGGWDMSHSQRIPTVLRTLWDARNVLRLPFPDSATVASIGNQYAFVVYRPGFPGPLFHNFLDGGDGWYRVGANGTSDFTYAPSSICNDGDPTRHCLSRGAASGWQLLRFAVPTVGDVGIRLFELAADTAPASVAFRRRVWEAADDPFTWAGMGRLRYSPLLAQMIGEYLLGGQSRLPQ